MSVLASGTTKEFVIDGVNLKIKKLSYGDQKEAMRLSKNDEVGMLDVCILKSVIEWDIVDENGATLAITQASLDMLESSFINNLSTEIMAFNNIAPVQEKN